MELRQLATFVAVAEEASFTRAAGRLHIVQSAVSAGVRSLEKELGAMLFDRSTHSVRLTDAGHALLPEARATLAAAQAARDAVDEARGGLRGTVVLGTMQAQGMRAIDLAGVLAAFRAEHPGVGVQIRHSGGSSELARDVRDGRLDLAFVAFPGDSPPGVELLPLACEPIMLAMPAGHPLAARTDVELSALRDEPLVDLPAGWGIRMAVDRAFAAAGLSRTITYEVNDTATMLELIRNGLAIGMLPRSLADGTRDIVFVPTRDQVPPFQTAITLPANRRLSAATRAMLETIKRGPRRGIAYRVEGCPAC
ncbi:MAG TPA: LysR family transcriptional regulator [Solirubrobacteraceae bacterium]|jgi:DNA-binding transcriptional LysR family regulator|nr:LysR family transcriptional regulator [Solirubrobacteraceae bacterium]